MSARGLARQIKEIAEEPVPLASIALNRGSEPVLYP
jgi:hypothetical protein